ncbi:MAG: stress response translation initiation inhibitor YciH [Nanoarchaeota archaeon]|nr:stress response translation initiation inhibitor YciH [Nanoarchaeota archaeon]
MSKICTICGLPEELCVCETIAKEKQQITLSIIKKKFGKKHTLIEGIDTKQIDIKEIGKKLKAKLACGGTVKGGKIELQGDHKAKVVEILKTLGFDETSIDVK